MQPHAGQPSPGFLAACNSPSIADRCPSPLIRTRNMQAAEPMRLINSQAAGTTAQPNPIASKDMKYIT